MYLNAFVVLQFTLKEWPSNIWGGSCQGWEMGIFQHALHSVEEVLRFEYDQEAVLTVTGRKMSCCVFGAQRDTFPTAVVAQGRDRAVCEGARPCRRADKCPLIDRIETDDKIRKCSYRCPCNGLGTTNCQKVVMFLGNDSLAVGRNYMKVCDLVFGKLQAIIVRCMIYVTLLQVLQILAAFQVCWNGKDVMIFCCYYNHLFL